MAFLHTNNLSALWEIISDEPLFQQLDESSKLSLWSHFTSNASTFAYPNRSHLSLMDLNKQYLLHMHQVLKSIPPTNTQPTPTKIKIHTEQVVDPESLFVTHEDLQKRKRNLFEQELSRKQNEFREAITQPVPPTPNFSLDEKDQHMTPEEMQKAIQQITAIRNYDTPTPSTPNITTNPIATSTEPTTNTSPPKKKISWNEDDIIIENMPQPLDISDETYNKYNQIKTELKSIQSQLYFMIEKINLLLQE